jgi:DNA polymerase/3'-5' exonuclease PolX
MANFTFMSTITTEQRVAYEQALPVAKKTLALLRPHCYRAEIAGSLRRKKATVKDIEIVAIPKPFETGLFSSGIASVVDQWTKVKGDLHKHCKYTQRIVHADGIGTIKLDLFFAEEANWGCIYLIRTGDEEFSKQFMGTIIPRNGYRQKDGYLQKNGTVIWVREEQDLFDMMHIPFIPPELRDERILARYSPGGMP